MKRIDYNARVFFIHLWLTLFLFLGVILAIAVYLHTDKQLGEAYRQRQMSIRLANELRNTSDDLTRMVNTYVITRDPIYKQHIKRILDIRDGHLPRPQGYEGTYWDLLVSDEQPSQNSGQAIPLLELLRKTGVNEVEFAKLRESKIKSDQLTKTEFAAMGLAETSLSSTGNAHVMAISILNDKNYHLAKAEIMAPLREFEQMVERRTQAEIQRLDDYLGNLRWLLGFTAIFLVFLIWNARRTLRNLTGSSLEAFYQRIDLLGSGNFSAPLPPSGELENTMMGKLCEAQRRLEQLNTSRSLAENELRKSEQRFYDIANASGDWVWESDADFRLVYASDGAKQQLGYSLAELMEKFPSGLMQTEEARRISEKIRAILDKKSAFRNFEMTVLNSSGRVCVILCNGNPIFDQHGQLTGYRGVVREITDDQRIAAAAFESGEGMVITDHDGNVIRLNKAFLANSGYEAHDLIGKKMGFAMPSEDAERLYAEIRAKLRENESWQGEVTDRRKNGQTYPKWLSVSAVKDNSGVVTHYISTHFDLSERKEAEEKIVELAYYDQLTKLPNRTLFLDRLRQALMASFRNGLYGALFFIDLDNFKLINDTLGHDVGDQLLKMVAERLVSSVRKENTVARLGGDEFVLIAQNLGKVEQNAAHSAEIIGEKLLQVLNKPYLLANTSRISTPSVGVTLFCNATSSIEKLMKEADMAMYKAKAAGRNTLRFFDPEMEAYINQRAVLEKDLREGIDAAQFVLYYQPQLVHESGIVSAEALLRWQHPERGLVSPAEFIPLAEETNLIQPLGNWVLKEACRQLTAWADDPELSKLSVAVNVSVRQFYENNFVKNVLSVLSETGADPRKLKLEITESLLMDRVSEVVEKMQVLKNTGICFSLDDFCTGYSSLANIRHLPLDQIKIDRSFVHDIGENMNTAAIVGTILALGESLGIEIIAEGVETTEQRDFLAKAGCHAWQGYLFSPPVPVDEFVRLVKGAYKP